MLPLGRNKLLGWIKEGGRPDLALMPCICHLWCRAFFNATISLLIFCLEDLSIFDSGVLKSTAIIVLLLISLLKSSKIFFIYLGAPIWVHIYLQCLCLLDGFSLEYYEVTFWVSFYGPFFEVIVSDMTVATPAFFFFFLSICLEYLFPALHFQSV